MKIPHTPRFLSRFGRWLRSIWRRTDDVRRGLFYLLVAVVLATTFLNSRSADSNSAAAKSSSATAVVAGKTAAGLAKSNLIAQNNHHTQTSQQNATQIAQNKTIIQLQQQAAVQAAQIVALLNEHSDLLQQVANGQAAETQQAQALATEETALKVAEAAITTDGNYIVAWQSWAANVLTSHCTLNNSCPPPPAAP